MRISDWSSDVCSSDLARHAVGKGGAAVARAIGLLGTVEQSLVMPGAPHLGRHRRLDRAEPFDRIGQMRREVRVQRDDAVAERPMFVTAVRSEEHTSELQSLMRTSYAVFCLKKKT